MSAASIVAVSNPNRMAAKSVLSSRRLWYGSSRGYISFPICSTIPRSEWLVAMAIAHLPGQDVMLDHYRNHAAGEDNSHHQGR